MTTSRRSKTGALLAVPLLLLNGCQAPPEPSAAMEHEALITEYVEAWKAFYPSRALRMGLEEYRSREEDRSQEAVAAWTGLNESVLARIEDAPADLPMDVEIDLRLIRREARSQLQQWRDPSGEEAPFPLGRDRYARELELYYDFDLTPQALADRALAEIETTRNLMAEVALEHWREAHPGEPLPSDPMEALDRALADMEENRPSSQQESLEAFTRFANEAEAFVRDQGIATLPETRTLVIVNTPDSAGPAQRIGFVDAPPPFDTVSPTVLSLPTIPDSFPAAEKEDFYRSFNNHFNKAIIIHELFPGHYMQAKIASRYARPARIFFPYDPYVEGWATLTEVLALDGGWDDYDKLTYLAHLRKRLENANRAYTSVQVHCFGWGEEEVLRFSREEALLAPQFAASLFGRLQRGPMQMTSYFMGKEMFVEALEAVEARSGEGFQLKDFTDGVLRAGPVPMDMIPEMLAEGT